MKTRRRFTAEFKAKVALEAIRCAFRKNGTAVSPIAGQQFR
jgi:hypothetical protein